MKEQEEVSERHQLSGRTARRHILMIGIADDLRCISYDYPFPRSGSYAFIQVWQSQFAGVSTLTAKSLRVIFLKTGADSGIRLEKLCQCLEHDEQNRAALRSFMAFNLPLAPGASEGLPLHRSTVRFEIFVRPDLAFYSSVSSVSFRCLI
jgi:hypothetical protein